MNDYRMIFPSCTTGRSPSDSKPIHYAVELDMEALAYLARKAAKNRGQKSNIGPVRVTILNPGKAEFLKGGA